MEIQTENYLNFSDEILETLMDLQSESNFSSSNLILIENVIEEYCTLLGEISKKEGPEYVELGNIALDILKISMHFKSIMEERKLDLNTLD